MGKRVHVILEVLKEKYPVASTALVYSNTLELLVATILSAQCTDKQVNKTTQKLFRKYLCVRDYANVDLQVFEQDIRSTGFYKTKARNIKNCCRVLIEHYDSEVPRTMEELVTLPGVARKTANIVLLHGFGIVEGIAVDTHVKRVAIRLGLSDKTDPVKIEQDLMETVSKEDWASVSDLFIWHGRDTCDARKPRCSICCLNELCPSAGKF